jgi:hypothetical protein
MNPLTLESFFSSDTDWELNQFKILGGIKQYRSDFDRKKLYPSLANLIKLSSMLEEILKQKGNLDRSFPKGVRGFDLINQRIIFESLDELSPDLEFLFKLIDWAFPIINKTIEEGTIVYDFVEKNMKIEQVGILPLYKEEGYFMIKDNIASELQIHRYECSLFSSGNEKYRALKTELIKTIKDFFIGRTPEFIKHELIGENKNLPNPATFVCETDLDFPFAETIFPVAKRKLMSYLTA